MLRSQLISRVHQRYVELRDRHSDKKSKFHKSAWTLRFDCRLEVKRALTRCRCDQAQLSLWSQVAQANLIEHVVRLKTRVDLRPYSPGRYELTVESASGLRFVQPVQLMKPKQGARSDWRSHILASMGSRLISIHLPSWSR